MAETSAIEWTDATVNFWWGCTKVGPGCDHCYAEAWNAFRGNGMWGAGAPRRKVRSAVALIRRLQMQSDAFEALHGRRRRCFCQSMSDTFDNEVDPAWRDEAFAEIAAADRLDVQLVTKRVTNVRKLVPAGWKTTWPWHVGLMITVVDQGEADRDMPRLHRLQQAYGIPWVGLSIEPMLGPMDLSAWLAWVDWVVVGGESGRFARPFVLDWAMEIVEQCRDAGVPVLVKQLGANPMLNLSNRVLLKHRKGADWREWPDALRVRQWPRRKAA